MQGKYLVFDKGFYKQKEAGHPHTPAILDGDGLLDSEYITEASGSFYRIETTLEPGEHYTIEDEVQGTQVYVEEEYEEEKTWRPLFPDEEIEVTHTAQEIQVSNNNSEAFDLLIIAW